MEVIKDSLDKFIAGKKSFTIPVYQRKYDWKQEHCRQLFDDIEKIISTGQSHFFGTFVYQRQSIIGSSNFDEYIIIDGQQRITSVILLAKALHEILNDDDKEEIFSTFIKHTTGKGMKNKCKLKPTEYDLPIFEKFMNYDFFDENNFDKNTEKNSMLYQNYVFFRKRIAETDCNAEEIYKAIQKLNIVGINVEIGENPQEIFESINSTGLELSQSDLVRNYLLMALDYDCQENLYKKYWLQMELLLHSTENFETFMLQYLITKRRSDSLLHNDKKKRLSKKNLYYSFKKYFEENYNGIDKAEEVEKYLKDMYRYAKFYNKFLFTPNDNFDQLDTLGKKFYELTFLLDSTNAPIILMYLYDKYEQNFFDEQTFINCVDAMISLTFRAKLCNCNGISTQFAGNVILRLEQSRNLNIGTFWDTITFGKGAYAFPNDERFREKLIDSDLQAVLKVEGCRYLLYSLERKTSNAKELPKYSGETASIEHIMPRTLNEQWKNYLTSKNDLQSHEHWLNTLGNLTLTGYNPELSNSDFKKKKIIYAKSNFFYTKELVNYFDWTSIQIQVRAKKLANAALKVWTLPEKYNIITADVGNVFTLDSDSGIFTGTKPSIVSISNVETELKNWSDFLREVMKTLYTLDKEIFKKAIQKDNVPRSNKLFSNESEKLWSPLKIEEDYYIANKFDFNTETAFKVAKTLVENFDSIGDTNFKEDIWFTLKKQ